MPPDGSNRTGAKLIYHPRVAEKVADIKAYIDEQRGNIPEDTVGLKVALKVLVDINTIRQWPWFAPQAQGLGENYRQLKVGNRYILYYYVEDPKTLIYLLDLS